MEDEPEIAQDLLDMLISDSQTQVDNVMVYHAYSLANSNLLGTAEKIEFLKQNEQSILRYLNEREAVYAVNASGNRKGIEQAME